MPEEEFEKELVYCVHCDEEYMLHEEENCPICGNDWLELV